MINFLMIFPGLLTNSFYKKAFPTFFYHNFVGNHFRNEMNEHQDLVYFGLFLFDISLKITKGNLNLLFFFIENKFFNIFF